MKRFISIFASIAMLGVFVSACATDDISSGDAFRAAFPDEDTLTIKTKSLSEKQDSLTDMSQALVGDRADLHDLSFAVAFNVNRYARNILELVWFVTRFQPTVAVAEDGVIGDPGKQFHYNARAVWGPFNDDEGKNLEYILNVWRGVDEEDGRTTFLYFIAGRPVGGTDDDWVPFLVGGAKPFDGNTNRLGLVQLDMNALRTLDSSEDDVGVFSFVYMQEADSHVVAATGEGVWSDDDHTNTTDATYFYGRSSEGYAVLEFDTNSDLEDDSGDALEHIHVTTGWLYNGDGRSDAQVSGGDLGDASASLTECWGGDHVQTYFLFNTQGADPEVNVEDGQVSSCFTPDPLDLPEIDYEAIRSAFD